MSRLLSFPIASSDRHVQCLAQKMLFSLLFLCYLLCRHNVHTKMLNIARQSADRWPQLRVDFMVYDTFGAFIKCATHDTTEPQVTSRHMSDSGCSCSWVANVHELKINSVRPKPQLVFCQTTIVNILHPPHHPQPTKPTPPGIECRMHIYVAYFWAHLLPLGQLFAFAIDFSRLK